MTQLQTRLRKLEAKRPKAKGYSYSVTDILIVYRDEGEDVYRLSSGETLTAEELQRLQASRPKPPDPNTITTIEIYTTKERDPEE